MESQRIDNHEVYLCLRVIQSEGIDDPYLIVKGLPNPVRNASGTIFLKEYPNMSYIPQLGGSKAQVNDSTLSQIDASPLALLKMKNAFLKV
ncbi:histidine--tRNA ligase [Sesbania bispinosa]|nr:histidine--tRNA ligase [Sesbania bispinosa]